MVPSGASVSLRGRGVATMPYGLASGVGTRRTSTLPVFGSSRPTWPASCSVNARNVHTRPTPNREPSGGSKRAVRQACLAQGEDREHEAADQQPDRHEGNEGEERKASQEMDGSLGAHGAKI